MDVNREINPKVYIFTLLHSFFIAALSEASEKNDYKNSDQFLKQKYYCITVHNRTVCASENRLGQTVQTGQQSLRHLELFSDYVRWPTPN